MRNKILRYFLPLIAICLSITLFTAPAEAKAADATASNLNELAVIVNKYGTERKESFSVKYTGPKKDIEYVVNDDYFSFFFKELVICDDPTTSDDADYLAYNLDFYSGKHKLYYKNDTIYLNLKY